MRKLITIIVVLFALQTTWAQEEKVVNNSEGFLEVGINPSILTSEENQGDVNWVVKLGSDLGEYSRVAFFYERYNAINYVSYGIQPSFKTNLVGGLEAGLGTEISIIERYGNKAYLLHDEHSRTFDFSVGFNGEMAYRFGKPLSLYLRGDLKHRPDTPEMNWDLKSFVGIRFYFL